MNLDLKNKVALIGGASQGLGHAIAVALAAEGVKVSICARNEPALLEAAKTIPTPAENILAVPTDLTEPAQLEKWIATTRSQWGKIDILINNAGGPPPGTFENLNQTQWQQATNLLLYPPIQAIHQVLPDMKKQRWGRILNVTSIAVKQPVPGLMLSNALRAALTGMAKTLAAEISEYNITVNNIAPGYFNTERLQTLITATAKDNNQSAKKVEADFMAMVPMGRLGIPKEFGEAATFLCSNQASYITGTTLQIDGGLSRGI